YGRGRFCVFREIRSGYSFVYILAGRCGSESVRRRERRQGADAGIESFAFLRAGSRADAEGGRGGVDRRRPRPLQREAGGVTPHGEFLQYAYKLNQNYITIFCNLSQRKHGRRL